MLDGMRRRLAAMVEGWRAEAEARHLARKRMLRQRLWGPNPEFEAAWEDELRRAALAEWHRPPTPDNLVWGVPGQPPRDPTPRPAAERDPRAVEGPRGSPLRRATGAAPATGS